MKTLESAAPFVPASENLKVLAEAARGCRGCELYRDATQTVFGEGLSKARLMMIGEQPGDQEDRAGKPFVGPAGKLLDKALEEAGIRRTDVYISNAVKHFRFTLKGKIRFHQKPAAKHIQACRPWLEAEVHAIQPEVIVCLGASAGQSLLQRPVTIYQERGRLQAHPWGQVLITVHPSSILRSPMEADHHRNLKEFVEDLKKVKSALN